MAVTVICVRHGETNANKFGQIQGISDIDGLNDLNSEGLDQASLAAWRLLALGLLPDIIFVSNLKRARQTAEMLIHILTIHLNKHIPIIEYNSVRERDYGLLEGAFWKEISQSLDSCGKNLSERFPDMGIETNNSIQVRVLGFKSMLRRFYQDRTVLLVAHAGFLRMWLELEYPGSTACQIGNGEFVTITI